MLRIFSTFVVWNLSFHFRRDHRLSSGKFQVFALYIHRFVGGIKATEIRSEKNVQKPAYLKDYVTWSLFGCRILLAPEHLC